MSLFHLKTLCALLPSIKATTLQSLCDIVLVYNETLVVINGSPLFFTEKLNWVKALWQLRRWRTGEVSRSAHAWGVVFDNLHFVYMTHII